MAGVKRKPKKNIKTFKINPKTGTSVAKPKVKIKPKVKPVFQGNVKVGKKAIKKNRKRTQDALLYK